MGAVCQWERVAIGQRTRDALRYKLSQGQRAGNIPFGYRLAKDGRALELEQPNRRRWLKSTSSAALRILCA